MPKATHGERLGRSSSDKIYDAMIFMVLTALFLIVAYPLYFVIISSVSRPDAVAGGEVTLWPVGFTLAGYRAVFEEQSVLTGFINSIFYTALGTSINLFCTIPTAYALSRPDFTGRSVITVFYMVTMFIGGGTIPTYIVIRNLGMLDTPWALVVPGAVSVWNLIVARTFYKTTLPGELLEAAKIDGCGNTRFFIHIALPLSGAILAIMVLYYGVGHWNSYFSALLYMSSKEKYPLQLVLRSLLVQSSAQRATTAEEVKAAEYRRQVAELMKYSLIIVSSIPVMILYPFIQKHFVKGVMIGSVKG